VGFDEDAEEEGIDAVVIGDEKTRFHFYSKSIGEEVPVAVVAA
jgi:hypothetical protein